MMREETVVHTRLLRFTLGIEESRAYWRRVDPDDGLEGAARALRAFESHWFGLRSQARVETIVANLRPRYDAFRPALDALRAWTAHGDMEPDTRRLICHWHTQLADPMYRAFTGEFLVERRFLSSPAVTRDRVVEWVERRAPDRWAVTTRTQWASKLLSAAFEAGLLQTNRDPRLPVWPRVSDDALLYLLHLLRALEFEGALLDNPYLASVGLAGGALGDRLRGLDGVRYARMGDLAELEFDAPPLAPWRAA